LSDFDGRWTMRKRDRRHRALLIGDDGVAADEGIAASEYANSNGRAPVQNPNC
jgi:hypothetical protein